MDFIEAVGGIKAEFVLIKTETLIEDEANAAEIKAEDIQDEIKKEAEENAELDNLEHGTNNDAIQIGAEDIGTSKVKEENEQYNKTDPGKGKSEVKNDTDLPETETVQEILNYTNEDDNKNNKKPSKESYLDKKIIGRDEYALVDIKQYRCNHCQLLTTSKMDILKHIRHYHRNTVIFSKEERFKKLDGFSSTSWTVAWYEYKAEDGDQYRCNHCQVLIQGQRQTEKHIRAQHRTVKMNQCPHCSYQSEFGLSAHIKSHHTNEKDIKYFRCHKCDYKAKFKSSLRRHMLRKHTDVNEILDKMNRCSRCPKTVLKKEGLTQHVLRIHNAETMEKLKSFHCCFECSVKKALIHHIESRHITPEDLETAKCEQCAFRTKFKTRMQSHFHNTHKQVPQCHICSYQCTKKTLMDPHLIDHNREKEETNLKYHCDRCDYKTYKSYNLQVHKLNHLKPEEIQYFYCYHCSFKAKRKYNLKSHIYRHYKRDEILLQCYICDFTTSKRDQLFPHINTHSKKQIEAENPKTTITSPTASP